MAHPGLANFVQPDPFCYASADVVAGDIMYSGCSCISGSVRDRESIRAS